MKLKLEVTLDAVHFQGFEMALIDRENRNGPALSLCAVERFEDFEL
jgi:hypothetical protein